jgi:hypothetical protein
MGGLGEAGEESPPRKSLLASCAALRDEVAEIIQGSREARLRFKKRFVTGVSATSSAHSRSADDAKKEKSNGTKRGLISE